MTLTVMLAVLFAALLHASWNALIKSGGDKVQGMIALTLGHTIVGVTLIAYSGWLPREAWGWMAASVLIHAAYQSFLALALTQGDLSRVYPISRGSAPLMVLAFGFLFLPDQISNTEYFGVIILGAGILLMARGVFSNGESRRMLPFAFGAALATAGYTVADGLGARAAGSATVYIGWLMTLEGLAFLPVCWALRGKSVFRIPMQTLKVGTLAGIASVFAYWIAVWGMTQAPIALVAALRETSIFFAVMIGWLFFSEKVDRFKALAACLIVCGAMITRL